MSNKTYDKYIQACKNGEYSVVKSLIKYPDDKGISFEIGFRWAVTHNHTDIVKLLLTAPTIKSRILPHIDDALDIACYFGHLQLVKYLLTSPELDTHANIHAFDDGCIRMSCHEGFTDIVKYLLTSPELKEHSDIHAKNDEAIKYVYLSYHMELIKFFKEELKIEVSESQIHNWRNTKPLVQEEKSLRM